MRRLNIKEAIAQVANRIWLFDKKASADAEKQANTTI